MVSNYQKMKEKARQEAIDWQMNASENHSMGELREAHQHFLSMGRKYGLIEEFRENGVI